LAFRVKGVGDGAKGGVGDVGLVETGYVAREASRAA
jgi:hypothetical protein